MTERHQACWQQMQAQYHDYERYSLIIKLIAGAAVFTLLFQNSLTAALASLLFFWALDAIWKTFQQRVCDYLEALEQEKAEPFALQQHFQANRPGALGLILAYVKTGLKPTVCLPYLILLGLLVGLTFIG